ncbi:GOLD domain-containing protein [Hirschfeldia incana]|nr:GOLD domain-containing protein [Hirschfeldia incana]
MAAKMSGGLLTGLLFFFLVPVMIQAGEAILQDMPPTDTRCACQEINTTVDIISEDHSTISVKVISPYNKNISFNVDRTKTTEKEKIEGMEVEIRKLEGTVKAIHENLLKLINGDADVMTVSRNTNTLLASYSAMAVIICIIVSIYQVVYLKAYIETKILT